MHIIDIILHIIDIMVLFYFFCLFKNYYLRISYIDIMHFIQSTLYSRSSIFSLPLTPLPDFPLDLLYQRLKLGPE